MTADTQHYPVKAGALGGRYVIAKLGKQRKAREWLVQATSDDRIIVSWGYGMDGQIGTFNVDGSGGRLAKGAHFPMLAAAVPFEFPRGFMDACLDVCQPLDAETTSTYNGTPVITVAHTVRVIGGSGEVRS